MSATLLRDRAGWLFLGGAGAAVLLLAWGLVAPRLALGGLLAGLLFWLGLALGSYTLLAVQALTGGRWLAPLFPLLAPAAASLAVLALLALPLLLGAAEVWPWVGAPGLARHADVARWWLNRPGFTTRSAIVLAGWSLFGPLLVSRFGRRPGIGAAALLFHALALSVFGLDWVLSLAPSFRSTAFAMWLGVQQVLAALAACALLRAAPPGGIGKAGDLGKLLLAAALGGAYLGFVQYLVAWYGNLPHLAEWYLERQEMPWLAVLLGALALSVVLPVLALLSAAARRSPRMLAWVGGGVLAGWLLHLLWLVGPPFGALTIGSGLLAATAVGGVWLGLAGGPFAARLTELPDAG